MVLERRFARIALEAALVASSSSSASAPVATTTAVSAEVSRVGRGVIEVVATEIDDLAAAIGPAGVLVHPPKDDAEQADRTDDQRDAPLEREIHRFRLPDTVNSAFCSDASRSAARSSMYVRASTSAWL